MTLDRELLVRIGIALGIVLGVWLLGLLARPLFMRILRGITRRTPTDVDGMVLDAVGPQMPWWFLLLATSIASRVAGLPPTAHPWIDRFVQVGLVVSVAVALAAFLTRLITARAVKFPEAVPATTFTQNVVRIVVIGLGLLVAAGSLGIQITPLLTALGVGSLAVALALQPTLSNMIAGFHITIARNVRVGDFVELETGQQGFVQDIGWRATQVRELPNNVVIVPNAKMVEIIVRNYSLPEPEQSVVVQVGVSYASDLAHVERVTIDAARDVLREVQGGVGGFDPFIRYHTFGDSSINFSVILRVKEFTDRYLVTHEFVKRLHRRFGEAGIEIPFPQRVVHRVGAPPAAAAEG